MSKENKKIDRLIELLEAKALPAQAVAPVCARYWLVHGHGPANHRHFSRDEAEREARRLASFNPGKTFAVLEVVAAISATVALQSCKISDDCTDGDPDFAEIPF